MVNLIVDRKSGYKISETEEVSRFNDKQEELIKRAKAARANGPLGRKNG